MSKTFDSVLADSVPEQLLTLAQQAGAETAEVYQTTSFSRPVFFETNRLKQLESSQARGYALRVWHNGRPGLAVAYGAVEPQALVDRALALAQLNEPQTPELTPARRTLSPTQGRSLPVEQLIACGQSAIAQIREAYPDAICSGELVCETETTTLINSQGLHCQYTDISLSADFGVERVQGEDFLGIYDGEYSHENLDVAPAIARILQRLAWAENQAKVPSGDIPVLLTANATTLLWGTVSAALNGKRVWEDSSPWSDRQGQSVGSTQLTLSQKPQLGPYQCPWDDEGTPTQELSLIQQGQLQQFYCDRTIAHRLNTTTTGNGFRPGLGRYPTPSLVNVWIEPGQGSLMELIAQIDHGVLIDQVLGGGADLSGDFSLNIDLGYRIEQGQVVGRLKDTMVAGNVYSALENIALLGDHNQWCGPFYTPTIALNGLTLVD